MIKSPSTRQDLCGRYMSRGRLNSPGVSARHHGQAAMTETCAKRMRWPRTGALEYMGYTFEAIEAQGADALLEKIRHEMIGRTPPLQAASAAKARNTEGWAQGPDLSIPAFGQGGAGDSS